MLYVHNEPTKIQSPFIAWAPDLTTRALASTMPELSYLRVEVARMRVGMGDFIIRVSSPRHENQVHSNTVVTLRANRSHGTQKGALLVATTVTKEMEKREDKTHTWGAADSKHMAGLLFPYLKFFVQNVALENMQFTTDALL